jgi:hypothetical protein
VARLAPAYAPRRPTETVLYRAVRDHLETFVAHAAETYAAPLPAYVEREFRGYMRCGVFAHGFTRCHCDTCGHDLLVAFACKGRGLCPSCAGRRMANTGAHLVDRVLPDVPVRQFVLSLPYELRLLAAFKPDVLAALARIFVEVVFASYRARAEREGIRPGQCGAVTFVQRFGGSLNLNVHFHTAFLDGVFSRDEGKRVRFHPAPAPDNAELQAIARSVHRRAMAWLGRHGYIDDRPIEARSTESPELGAIEACAAIAMHRGAFAKLAIDEDHGADGDGAREPGQHRFAAEHQGFNLHAGVRIAAGDDMGRERLARYGARPPLALDRLRRLPDGRVAYRVKYARRGAAKHRVMTAMELMARLSALVPPPRYPLVRFHGVLAPRSSWRRDVIPSAPSTRPRREPTVVRHAHDESTARDEAGAESPERAPAPTPRPSLSGSRPVASTSDAQGASSCAVVPDVVQLAHNVISVRHWQRLRDGALLAGSPYVDWARLLQRTFEVDVLACAHCGGRLRVLAVITEPEPVHRILEHLHMTPDPTPLARARDPTDDATESMWADEPM